MNFGTKQEFCKKATRICKQIKHKEFLIHIKICQKMNLTYVDAIFFIFFALGFLLGGTESAISFWTTSCSFGWCLLRWRFRLLVIPPLSLLPSVEILIFVPQISGVSSISLESSLCTWQTISRHPLLLLPTSASLKNLNTGFGRLCLFPQFPCEDILSTIWLSHANN